MFSPSHKLNNKGFTLVELLVVIAIIGILAIVATSFNFGSRASAEKRDRFAENIINLITKVKTDAMIGRAVSLGGNMINPTSTRLSVSTGSLVVNYLDSAGSVIGTGDTLKAPFYGDTGYQIAGFSFSGADGTDISPTPSNFSILFQGTNISFSGVSNSGAILWMTAGYQNSAVRFLLDKRTGRIDIKDTESVVAPLVPVNCVGGWGLCSGVCGGGAGTQTYFVTTPVANGGTACAFFDGTSSGCVNTNPCPITYNVSGTITNGSGASIAGCGGSTTTANSSGNFTFSGVIAGSNCSDIAASRIGYVCTITTQGPATLGGNVTTIAGNCTTGAACILDIPALPCILQ